MEAVQLSKLALEVRKKISSKEYKETLRSMEIVGLAFSLGSRWKEAEELQVQGIEIRNKVLGEEYPDTLTCMSDLVFIWKEQG